ncbi:putative holin-like toxin [Siminovitchia fortis]|nr:putative holin-like toxin [Siminovitchia fortis]WHY81236.1 putative holin-like toxin [Siminovitchia fortis]
MMTVYESMSLMIAFGVLIIALLSFNQKKIIHP